LFALVAVVYPLLTHKIMMSGFTIWVVSESTAIRDLNSTNSG